MPDELNQTQAMLTVPERKVTWVAAAAAVLAIVIVILLFPIVLVVCLASGRRR